MLFPVSSYARNRCGGNFKPPRAFTGLRLRGREQCNVQEPFDCHGGKSLKRWHFLVAVLTISQCISMLLSVPLPFSPIPGLQVGALFATALIFVTDGKASEAAIEALARMLEESADGLPSWGIWLIWIMFELFAFAIWGLTEFDCSFRKERSLIKCDGTGSLQAATLENSDVQWFCCFFFWPACFCILSIAH